MPHRLGRYAVQRRIGSGGFATVWLAYDEQLDSPVAVKVLADNWSGDAHVRQRFLEEGRYLRRVESPHVVTVYDAGELDDGRPYLVMTYADQGTLADRLELSGPAPGLTAAQSLQVIRQVADGLQALHDRDILHRDVKPANVLFRSVRSGTDIRAMLGDLGLGKALDMSSRLTLVAGTPSYVAPEQAAADPLDPRADQYSLAALSYLLLSGRPAFSHASLQAASAPGPVPPLSTEERRFADSVDAVVRRGLARSREDRFPSVTDFADALAAAMLESSGETPAVTAPGDPWLAINNELTVPGVRPTAHPAAQDDDVPHPREPEHPADGGPAVPGVTAPEPAPGVTAPAGAAVETPPPRRRRRWWRWVAAAAVLLVVGAGAGYAAYDRGRRVDRGPTEVTVADAHGEVAVTVPVSWDRYRALKGWTPPVHQPGNPESFPAVWVGTSDVWNAATVTGEGVFATIIPGDRMPEQFPGHPKCTATTPQSSRNSTGGRVLTTLFTACPGGIVVEQISQLTKGRLLWVQVHSDDPDEAYDVLGTVRTGAAARSGSADG